MASGRFRVTAFMNAGGPVPGAALADPEFVSGGTFVVGKSGSATLTMTTGVDPRVFRRMKITVEQPGSGRLLGRGGSCRPVAYDLITGRSRAT